MIVKDKGLPLVPVALLSLFLALSVYYVVDRVARSAENSAPYTHDDNNQNYLHSQKMVNPLAEILYQQLFMKKTLEMCPNFLKSVCKWEIDIPSEETTITRNMSKSLRKIGGVIVRSCQILGVKKYQDVCFLVTKNSSTLEMENDPNGRNLLRILLQNCTHVNDNGFPCTFAERVPNEKHEKKNVCISDVESFSNIVTHRCRHQVSEENNKIIPIENVVFTVGGEEKKNASGKENEQELRLGANKSTVSTNATSFVCHILLAALLIVSASVALFEVCRDRLGDKKLGQQSVIGGDGRRSSNAWTGSPCSSPDSRRYSLVDLAVSRHERKASIHLVQRAISFPVTSSPPTAPQKPLGARPPLLRRSSFPVHMNTACSGRVTPTSRSRRTSIDGNDGGDSSPDVAKRRVRFIRRY